MDTVALTLLLHMDLPVEEVGARRREGSHIPLMVAVVYHTEKLAPLDHIALARRQLHCKVLLYRTQGTTLPLEGDLHRTSYNSSNFSCLKELAMFALPEDGERLGQ
jgi:hypothetical protein